MSEKQYIESVLKGNTSSFNYFVETYQDMAITIAYRICRNMQDAEDIVQNAFVKAFHNLHTFRYDSKFSTWFYRIVYNTAIKQINTSIYTVESIDYNDMPNDTYSEKNVLDKIEEDEKKAVINQVMETMPRDESLILTLYYLEENSIKEIVQITGFTESNIKVKLHRARKRFGELVTSFGNIN